MSYAFAFHIQMSTKDASSPFVRSLTA